GRGQPAVDHRGKTGTAGNLRPDRPAYASGRDARYRNRETKRGPHDSGPRQAPDGEGAKRVLPQRENQSDPEGTGARREERDRRAEEADRDRGHDAGRAGKGDGGVETAGKHAADVGRIDGLAQLPGLAAGGAVEEEVEGNPRPEVRRTCARKRPLRAGKDQGEHPGVSGRAAAGEESEGFDPVFRGAS